MTARDRIVIMVIAVVVIAVGGWMLVISPKKKEVKTYESQVAQAQSQLSTAQGQLSDAKAAESQYATAYADVVNLGKAVPPSEEVASLVYELEQASDAHSVSFNSIVTGGAAAGSSSSSSSGSSSSSSSSSTASAGSTFTQMPFTFIFTGGFFSLEHLFKGLTGFTTHGSDGTLDVSGRLLTIQSVKLAPEASTGKGAPKMTGTVTATAYVLPATQGLTAGATPSSPAATSGSSSSTTTPAVAQVTP